jgi:tRNA threonylcarbamoyladenosine biosynthesis protein TsaB
LGGGDMYFLAIDTATNSGGVALARNAEVVGVLMTKTPLRYSERLIENIEVLLERFALNIPDIQCFVAASGPGSFTGLRIGMASVKAFCQSLNRPGIAVPTLEALAYRFRHTSPRVAPMVDARRQQIYGGLYESREGEVRVLRPDQASSPAEWLRGLPPEPCLFVGDGAQMYASAVAAARPSDRLIRSDNRILEQLCQLAYHRFTRGEVSEASELTVNYVRPSDAVPAP